ncbi:MAG: hypothetical protein L0207_06300 [Chlamydiae bacterium]|nr:hypothetical protein [Chlamydiota bacterium]
MSTSSISLTETGRIAATTILGTICGGKSFALGLNIGSIESIVKGLVYSPPKHNPETSYFTETITLNVVEECGINLCQKSIEWAFSKTIGDRKIELIKGYEISLTSKQISILVVTTILAIVDRHHPVEIIVNGFKRMVFENQLVPMLGAGIARDTIFYWSCLGINKPSILAEVEIPTALAIGALCGGKSFCKGFGIKAISAIVANIYLRAHLLFDSSKSDQFSPFRTIIITPIWEECLLFPFTKIFEWALSKTIGDRKIKIKEYEIYLSSKRIGAIFSSLFFAYWHEGRFIQIFCFDLLPRILFANEKERLVTSIGGHAGHNFICIVFDFYLMFKQVSEEKTHS